MMASAGVAPHASRSELHRSPPRPSENGLIRSLEFWRRASGIYLGYKLAQTQAQILRWRGTREQDIQDQHWTPHNDRSGKLIYDLCVDLRGFFLKAGQFIGARSDFFPEAVCAHLRKLQDEVPPMPPHETEAILKQELQVNTLSSVFEWIDFDRPLGSASIAQVHKAKLRRYVPRPSALRRALGAPAQWWRAVSRRFGRFGTSIELPVHTVRPEDTAWSIANVHGVSLEDVMAVNKSKDLHAMRPGDSVYLPADSQIVWNSPGQDVNTEDRTIEAVRRANTAENGPTDDLVAVKVQYPDALTLFVADLGNIRRLAGFLEKTELAFDLISAVDELSSQVKLEFDFKREARVMDTTCTSLRKIRSRVVVPHSIPGLVTNRVLTMSYLRGVPLTKLEGHLTEVPQHLRKVAFRKIISHASEAYGRMILETGLFQADGHPGNMLAMKQGVVGLIDYGQSKQITDEERWKFARLVIALAKDNSTEISRALDDMGIKIETTDVELAAQHGKNMFDTVGEIDVFAEDNPLKKAQISEFPKDYFLILRVVQLVRGLASHMDIDFSTAKQWEPFAKRSLREKAAKTSVTVVPDRKGKFYGI